VQSRTLLWNTFVLNLREQASVQVTSAPKALDANPLQPLLDALTNAEKGVENAFDDTAEALIDNFNSLALPPSLQSKVDTVCT
jgi:hypothetical protein